MVKIENIQVFNLEGALRGMRFPMQSGEKSDSYYNDFPLGSSSCSEYVIGPNDLALARKLIAAGADHSKFTRQILVSMDITAPLYLLKEFDTYKVATVANSESTMHTIMRDPFTIGQFSADDELLDLEITNYPITHGGESGLSVVDAWDDILYSLNHLRERFLETKDKRYWRALIQLLPSSWNQKRHWTGNYQNLLGICHSRKGHKLIEWSDFIKAMKNNLPYFTDFLEVYDERKV
jgi:hypothetical protein